MLRPLAVVAEFGVRHPEREQPVRAVLKRARYLGGLGAGEVRLDEDDICPGERRA
jgi:hypothetical protein